MPSAVGEGYRAFCHQMEEPANQARVAGETHFDRVFEDRGQEASRRFGAQNGPPEPRGQEVRQPPDVVEMHVGEEEGTDVAHREIDLGVLAPGVVALEQAAIDQNRASAGKTKLMARAGDSVDRAVVQHLHGWLPLAGRLDGCLNRLAGGALGVKRVPSEWKFFSHRVILLALDGATDRVLSCEDALGQGMILARAPWRASP